MFSPHSTKIYCIEYSLTSEMLPFPQANLHLTSLIFINVSKYMDTQKLVTNINMPQVCFGNIAQGYLLKIAQ